MKITVLGLSLLLSAACHDPQSEILKEDPLSKKPGNPPLTEGIILLEEGEHVTLPEHGLELSLESLQDSRCPGDAICITAGEALVSVKLSNKKMPLATKELQLCLDCQEIEDSIHFELSNRNYLLILKDVKPFPFSSQPETMKNKTVELLLHPQGR